MSSENPYTRFDKAVERLREAERATDDLAARLASVAKRLADWRVVGFEGETNGVQVSTPTATKRVRFGEMPSLDDFYRAKQAWLDARSEARGALAAMTAEQRAAALRSCPDQESEIT